MRNRLLPSTIRTVGRFQRAVRRYAANVRGYCPACDEPGPCHTEACDVGRGSELIVRVGNGCARMAKRPEVFRQDADPVSNPLAELI